ncbi:hypothetical protein [Chryseobacterium rhizosphaerae]|uniref:Uncharacterized protein n=1 Tax=Chryseobacterium rhizosphaerae TaxID=395937 RepID=A0ABX9IQD8_9FLAO|nr:hypothetical protein [Chryseobacterium rhizosphaerae]MDC8102231.1 hypothetical protein [Chryseobacterium rhizosphaerae]REC78313.1 hypothetical protein DRF57_02445 [Chryseobacterium rhizosphaerae]GEN66601.1 hypothetical protein CRH01_11690 [Chryseobacterium rhizosphaerae]
MPKLNEYLGGIVSEIAAARKMTDLQTVQIAKEYAKDDLLKHFSIPRMKVGTVDLTIPFAAAGSSPILPFRDFSYDEITKVAQADYNPSDIKNDQNLKNFLANQELSYNDYIKKIKAENKPSLTDTQIQYFEPISKYTVEYCRSLSNFTWNNTDPQFLSDRLFDRIVLEARRVIEKTDDREIIVEASKLMQLDAKCLIFAKMSVSEAGMEWSRYEDINGNIIETLIPE